MATEIPGYVPVAVAERGGHPESVHFGAVAIADASGELIGCVGDATAQTFSRSTSKPFQAMPLVAHPQFGTLGWTAREIAIACGSHSGEAVHTELVGRMLAGIGAEVQDLACGVHVPYRYDAQGLCPEPAAHFSPLEHNCSGKHAGMLALAGLLEVPRTGYGALDHPVQVAIREAVAYWSGVPTTALGIGIDGCGVPNFALPLRALANAYARLVNSRSDQHYGEAAHRICNAMRQHPELVSGIGRFDLRLAQAGQAAWLTKIGAEGMHCLGVPSRGWGIAIKIADGGDRGARVTVIEVLRQLGLLTASAARELHDLASIPVVNCSAIEVGRVRPVLKLEP